MAEPKRKTFATSDGEFSYLEWDEAGHDAPSIHFAHANGMNANTYKQLLAPLANKFHIYALDARGHGFTKAPADPAKLNRWATFRDDLIRFIEFIDKPVVLVGHSLGAVTSMKLAGKRPDLLRGLIMFDPVMFPPTFLMFWRMFRILDMGKKAPIAAQAIKRRAVWPDTNAMLDSYRGKGAFKTWGDQWIIDYLDGGTKERVDGQIELSCSPKWEARIFATLPSMVWKHLALVKCPITLLYGGKSNTFFEKSAQAFRHIKPDERLICYQESSHFLPIEEPEKVRAEIINLCEKICYPE